MTAANSNLFRTIRDVVKINEKIHKISIPQTGQVLSEKYIGRGKLQQYYRLLRFRYVRLKT